MPNTDIFSSETTQKALYEYLDSDNFKLKIGLEKKNPLYYTDAEDAIRYYYPYIKRKEEKSNMNDNNLISPMWINILIHNQATYSDLVDLVMQDKNPLVIYVANLSRNKNKKYLFRLIDASVSASINVYDLKLERLFNEKSFADKYWTKSIENGKLKEKSGFVLLSTLISKYGIKNMEDILLPNYYNELKDSYTKTNKEEDKMSSYDYVELAANKEAKEKPMSNKMNKVISKNTDAAKVAAKITAGKAVNAVVLEKLKPQLPMLMRGYADHPLASIVVANVVSFAVDSMASDNEKAVYIANAMMQAAMTDFLGKFDIEKLLTDVLKAADVTVPEAE